MSSTDNLTTTKISKNKSLNEELLIKPIVTTINSSVITPNYERNCLQTNAETTVSADNYSSIYAAANGYTETNNTDLLNNYNEWSNNLQQNTYNNQQLMSK